MSEPNRIAAIREAVDEGWTIGLSESKFLLERITVLERELEEARATVEARDGTLMMTVGRLEGLVEGRPTERINFLQRIDELREKERALRALQQQIQQDREIVIAEAIARIAHFGQTTGSEGKAYITHPEAVAASLPESLKAAGWLHDVLEDSVFTATDLLAAGISQATVEIVQIVSRDKTGETYEAFIDRVGKSGNAGAIDVKLADLRHNLRPSCPPTLRARYIPAEQKLAALLPSLAPSPHE